MGYGEANEAEEQGDFGRSKTLGPQTRTQTETLKSEGAVVFCGWTEP